jgi:hypothetical protein
MCDMKKKAEAILENYANFYSQVDLETLAKTLCQIESEAIKGFAEKVRKLWGNYDGYAFEGKFNELVKEMVGDSDER